MLTDEEIHKSSIEALSMAIMSGVHSPDDIKLLVNLLGLNNKSGCEIEELVDKVIQENLDKIKEYKLGKTKLIGFFVGQVMKQSGGTADPKVVNIMLVEKLKCG
ncbi:MAG TPA: hypothetical protein VK553_06230 [Candidatus Nitrosopolaris rasttigaisensis]|nr:hypothetical protein [Candidatus Nitrosopolaris rasttigaisensis]